MTFREMQAPMLSADTERQARLALSLKDGLKRFFKFDGDFLVLPSGISGPEASKGILGYALFRTEYDGAVEKEETLDIDVFAAPEARMASHATKEKFDKAFVEAWDAKHPIRICDDPMLRLCGFIVETREERVWHVITLTRLKGGNNGE